MFVNFTASSFFVTFLKLFQEELVDFAVYSRTVIGTDYYSMYKLSSATSSSDKCARVSWTSRRHPRINNHKRPRTTIADWIIFNQTLDVVTSWWLQIQKKHTFSFTLTELHMTPGYNRSVKFSGKTPFSPFDSFTPNSQPSSCKDHIKLVW